MFAKKMVKTNQDIIGEQSVRDNDIVLVLSNEIKKMIRKGYHAKLLNT